MSLALALLLTAARPLAVLPPTGVSMTTAEMQDLVVVDEALRTAAPRDGFAVQAKEATLAGLQSARASNVACGIADVVCWRKLAVLDEVELLLVPVATIRPDGAYAVVITLVDSTGTRPPDRAVAALWPKKELDVHAKALVDEVFARAAEPVPDVAVVDAPAPPVEAPAPPPAPPDDPAAALPWIIGGTTAGAVVVGAIAGGLVAWAVATAPPRRPHALQTPNPSSWDAAVVIR